MTSDITQPSRFTALEILDGDPNYRDPTFQIIFPPVFGALAGFYTFALNNWILGRPKYTGIHRHILGGIGGFCLGLAGKKYRQYRKAEHDAHLRYYVELHPEEFIFPERKKWADVLEPWVPIR